MAIVKRYSNGEITVVWKPDLCIHSQRCFQGLPGVFDPRVRPWVRIDGAATEAIVRQVEQCPSGALSWERDVPAPPSGGAAATAAPVDPAPVQVSASPNGPLMVAGAITVTLPDGTVVSRTRMTAFCRCGHSGKKPFCDGSHARAGFVG